MPWHIEPHVEIARYHPDGGAIERREPYCLACTVTWLTPTAVALTAMRGVGFGPTVRRQLADALRARGVRQVFMERNGRLVEVREDDER